MCTRPFVVALGDIHVRCACDTQALRGFDYGAYKLADFRLNTPEAAGSFLHVSRISEALTPRLVQTYYRSNFSMSRPWLTRLLRHLALLQPSMPGTDEAQVWRRLTGLCRIVTRWRGGLTVWRCRVVALRAARRVGACDPAPHGLRASC
jgi:hypothetical protein